LKKRRPFVEFVAVPRPNHRAAWAAVVLATAMPALLIAPLAGATHDVGHRYFVWGTITNTSGLPLPGITIKVEVPGATTYSSTPEWTGVTDTGGNFRILVHLHHLGGAEEDAGREIIIRAPSAGIERRATAEPVAPPAGEDPESTGWGYTRVDLQLDQVAPAPAAVPGPADMGAWLASNAVAVGIAVALIAGLVLAAAKLRATGDAMRLQRQQLSVAKLPGVGRATAEKLRANGIATIPQLARATAPELAKLMGISASEAGRLIRKAASHQQRGA
jgi:hypothetical protein